MVSLHTLPRLVSNGHRRRAHSRGLCLSALVDLLHRELTLTIKLQAVLSSETPVTGKEKLKVFHRLSLNI